MKLKRIIALSLSAAGLALALTACGSSSSASDDAAQASGSSDAQTTVKLGVVGAIYEDIWAPAKVSSRTRASTSSSYSFPIT